jgi:hypothetical protein
MVALLVSANHGLQLKWRSGAGRACEHRDILSHSALKLPLTLRLTRQGSMIRAEYAPDNSRGFRPAGAAIAFEAPLLPTVHIGLAITAIDTSRLSEAQFDRFEVRKP